MHINTHTFHNKVLAHILEFYLQNDNARPMTFLVGTRYGITACASAMNETRVKKWDNM